MGNSQQWELLKDQEGAQIQMTQELRVMENEADEHPESLEMIEVPSMGRQEPTVRQKKAEPRGEEALVVS